MGVTAPSTASIDEHTPLLAAQSIFNGDNTATDGLNKNEHPSRFSVASEDDDSVQEGPLTSFFRVFYEFSTPFDHTLRIIGVCAAIASGAALPCMTLVFGSFVDDFNSIGSGEQSSSKVYDKLSNNALWFLYLFIGRYVLVYIHSSCFGVSGIRATRALRQQFIKSVIRQDIAYIDSSSVGGITTTISASVDMVENGITEKVGSLIQAISMLVAGFVVAFTQQWKLTLVTATTLPVLFAGFYITFSLDAEIEGKILEIYNSASSLAEEAMSSMRMVTALNIGKRLAQKYDISLAEAQRLGLTKGPVIGFQYSVEMFTTYCAYALAWYYGTKLLNEGEIDSGGGMITVLLSVLLATQAASDVAPGFSGFTRASASAKEMFKMMNRQSQIDPLAEGGHKPEGPQESKVELRNVTFAYPSRPTQPILKDFSIAFEAGKTTALVGSSGSGKSTIVGLIERWFDADSGSVLVSGHAVTDLNVRWLRRQIGLVQQEPVLFSDSIYNNVSHGLYGTPMNSLPEVEKRELVRQACIQAFADDFIQDLPEKYDTLVGERGQLLSGGQKQRIAIARVVISNPRILILDEATSALDPSAENCVQAALDNVSKHRTTIMIAHKLSTVQRADKIVVLSHGEVIEQGTHQQLLAYKGSYHKFVHSQTLNTNNEGMRGSENSKGSKVVKYPVGYDTLANNGLLEVRASRSPSRDTDSAPVSVVNVESRDNQGEHDYEENDITKKLSLMRCIAIIIFQDQQHLWPLFLAGVISSAGSGSAFPAQAVLFGKSITTLQLPRGQHLVDMGNFWALMYFVFGLCVLVVCWGVGFWWTIASFRATRQYRREYFESMMHQDVAFFDLKGHSAHEMTSRLSLHPLHLQLLLSTNLALILLVFFNVIGCCILSLIVDWKLALPVMALGVPLLFGAGYFRMRMEMSNQDRVTAIYQEAARFASEAVGAIRTVSSLSLEHKVIDGYEKRLSESVKLEMRHKLTSMLLFAFSESISLAVSAFSFWYGGKLLSEGKCSVTTFFIVFIAISMGMQTAGFMFGFTSDFSKAHKSANHILDLRRSKPRINASTGNYDTPISASETAIEFKDVYFSYPSRPDVPVLRSFNLRINKGESVGIVGASGCGKSTIIALLERFYDADQGQILIGGTPVQQLDVQDHRSCLGLVSQDTTLYQGSIRDNILLGQVPDQTANDEESEMKADEAVIRACKLAHIHDFITSLPEGYYTNIGSHGMSLSGGQRQRLAIARALIREPDILLFDEATSALDTQSEALVQQAVEAITHGSDFRTVISVAHRLSTIKQCDRIFVLHRGRVVEEGTHEDLVARCGRYYEMVLAQNLETEAT